MELKIKFLNWSAGLPVAMLNTKTARKIGVHAKDRISIKTLHKKPKETSTILDTVQGMIKENEIAVSSELRKNLGLKNGQKVKISLSPFPQGAIYIREKLDGKKLDRQEIFTIIRDLVNNALSESEIALFISALHVNGMTTQEIVDLINAFLETGNKFDLKNKTVVNKHCIGGIPGNKTTPLVVAICAAGGLVFPKTSSRAVTSEAGTADFMETIAKVDFSTKELKQILKKTGGFIVWGGCVGLVPADSKIIKIEKVLNIDAEPLLLSSVLSKKLAVGSDYILIDIPYGKNAKVSKSQAKLLSRKFKKISEHFNIKLDVVYTKGDQPIGNGIGPVLELKDVLAILDPLKKGPKDLEDKAILLSGKLFEMTKKASSLSEGKLLAKQLLYSGKAFEKFREIIKEQKGTLKVSEPSNINKKIIYSPKSGKIKSIHNKKINSIARTAGCPMDKHSGMYFHKKKKEEIKKGEPLVTFYSTSDSRLKQAIKQFRKTNPVKIK